MLIFITRRHHFPSVLTFLSNCYIMIILQSLHITIITPFLKLKRETTFPPSEIPFNLDIFHEPRMHAFGGMLTVIVQAGEVPGLASVTVSGRGLRKATVTLEVRP